MKVAMAVLAMLLTAASPVAKTGSGAVRGAEADGVASFKGIPYAAPPVGPLRWHAPEQATKWQSERDATALGNDCMQVRFPGDTGNTSQKLSEDCLFLNIWSPKPQAGAKLPVMVYIHGGGFTNGSGGAAILDGTRLAARGVVVVTFNYRLGRFGFFAHPALTRESGGTPTGNWGLMDQIAALNWVKRNIAAFGGDPRNVSIFGESAGGESVDRLMASPAAKGLFAKAIASSGGGRDSWPSLAEAEGKGATFARDAGVASDDLTALRAIPAETVLGKINFITPDEARYSGPITDGRIVTGDTDAIFASGKQARVPYIVGSNSDELGFIPAPFLTGFNAKAAKAMGAGTDAVRTAYGSPAAYDRHIASDFTFTEPALALATRQSTVAPTWLYRFGYVAEGKRKPDIGAGHASDVPYQFDNADKTGDPVIAADMAAGKAMADRWVRFAKTGDPGWSRFDTNAPAKLSIGIDKTDSVPANDSAIAAIAAARDAAKK
jgi:para-nitrobenzyl esterase